MSRVLPMLFLAACGSVGAPRVDVDVTGPASVASPDQEGRAWRRMDIDQLDATLKGVTGGISWTEGSTNLFEALSGTLGKPEYLDSTNEDLVPGLLFQKFLGDAATSTCTQLIAAEQTRGDSERTFLVHVDFDDTASDAAGVDENLRHLLLVFHGRDVESGSDELAPWRTVVDDTLSATDDPTKAWRAVCVALILHPDFYSY